MRGANPHHESNADLYALDLPVELEAQESAVSPKLHSGCFKTTDKLIASLRRTFLCGADTRGNESWRGLQRQTPRNNIPCITSKMLSTAFWLQNRSWDAAQAGRHALDRQGRQRHHRPALQQAQRTLPGFLGTPLRAKAGGCMTSLNLMCARQRLSAVEGYSGWIRIVSLDESLGRENVLVPRIGGPRSILIVKG